MYINDISGFVYIELEKPENWSYLKDPQFMVLQTAANQSATNSQESVTLSWRIIYRFVSDKTYLPPDTYAIVYRLLNSPVTP